MLRFVAGLWLEFCNDTQYQQEQQQNPIGN
jgi:hypothetical protein